VGARGRVNFLPNQSDAWENRTKGSYPTLQDMAFSGSMYVATGSIILTSTDGKDWEVQTGGSPGGQLANVQYASLNGQDRWVVASRNNTSQIPLTTSANGTDWAFPPTMPEGFTDCQDLAYGNGIFVALPQTGTNSLITSTDGLTWTGTSTVWFTDKQYRCYVTFDNGMFMAYSTPTPTVEIVTSTNGLDWTSPVDTGLTGGTYLDAAYGDGRWVLVGTGGAVATSTDLTNWSEQVLAFDGFDPATLSSVSYAKGHWIISGQRNFIYSSEDGVNWISAFTNGQNATGYSLYSTLYDGVSFWAVGNDGVILKSGPLLGDASLSILPSPATGNVRLQVQGDPGDRWDILYSPTLPAIDWSILTTIDLEGGTATHDDPAGSNRYYILAPPGT